MRCLLGGSEAKPISNEDFGHGNQRKGITVFSEMQLCQNFILTLFSVTFSLSSHQRETAKRQCWELSLARGIGLLAHTTRAGWETVFSPCKTFQGFKEFPSSTLGNETGVNAVSEWKGFQDNQQVGVDGAHPQTG